MVYLLILYFFKKISSLLPVAYLTFTVAWKKYQTNWWKIDNDDLLIELQEFSEWSANIGEYRFIYRSKSYKLINTTDKLLLEDSIQFSCNYYSMQDFNRSFQNGFK